MMVMQINHPVETSNNKADCYNISKVLTKDSNNSVENNRIEHVLRLYKIRARIFGGSHNEMKIKEKIMSCNIDLINKPICCKRSFLRTFEG